MKRAQLSPSHGKNTSQVIDEFWPPTGMWILKQLIHWTHRCKGRKNDWHDWPVRKKKSQENVQMESFYPRMELNFIIELC